MYGEKKSLELMEKFCQVLRSGKSVSSAAESIGIARRTAFEWKASDPEFHKAWTDALEAGTDKMEQEAYRRAVDGYVGRPFQTKEGDLIEMIEYSDTLMSLMLKGRRPDVYGDKTKIAGHDGGALFDFDRLVDVIVDPKKPT
jgi:hypothetical protein